MEVVAQKLQFDACDIEDEELNISCRTNSSGYDVDDVLDLSGEDFVGSSPVLLQPRKLFNAMDCSDGESSTMPNNNNNKTPIIYVTG